MGLEVGEFGKWNYYFDFRHDFLSILEFWANKASRQIVKQSELACIAKGYHTARSKSEMPTMLII